MPAALIGDLGLPVENPLPPVNGDVVEISCFSRVASIASARRLQPGTYCGPDDAAFGRFRGSLIGRVQSLIRNPRDKTRGFLGPLQRSDHSSIRNAPRGTTTPLLRIT